jgi:hypothetical protein
LGLDDASAQKILLEVEEYQDHLVEYRSAFLSELSAQAELIPAQRRLLRKSQDAFGLEDAEIKITRKSSKQPTHIKKEQTEKK